MAEKAFERGKTEETRTIVLTQCTTVFPKHDGLILSCEIFSYSIMKNCDLSSTLRTLVVGSEKKRKRKRVLMCFLVCNLFQVNKFFNPAL